MRAKLLILFILTLLSVTYTNDIYSQKAPKSNRKAEKEVAKQRKEKGKEARKSDKDAMKKHYKAQGKKTSRRMKKNQRKTIKLKKNKRPPFWESWFSYTELEMYKIELLSSHFYLEIKEER
jgi:hypothetical protein